MEDEFKVFEMLDDEILYVDAIADLVDVLHEACDNSQSIFSHCRGLWLINELLNKHSEKLAIIQTLTKGKEPQTIEPANGQAKEPAWKMGVFNIAGKLENQLAALWQADSVLQEVIEPFTRGGELRLSSNERDHIENLLYVVGGVLGSIRPEIDRLSRALYAIHDANRDRQSKAVSTI